MVQVSVTVDDAHLDALDTVARALQARGMAVDQVFDGLGVIVGSVPSAGREALTGVEGVASVDEELSHQLPPPDAPVQ
jgi:hypothetical protein